MPAHIAANTVTLIRWLLVVAAVCAIPSFAAAEEGTEHAHEPNYIAVFVGAASEERRESGLALGIEYERRLNASLGVGAIVERTFGDIDATIYALPIAYHSGPWKLYAAPGTENGDAGNDALMRFGAEYGFEVNKWEIAPQLDIDFIDGDRVLVLGITFGIGY